MDLEKMRKELEAIQNGNRSSSSNDDDGIQYFKMTPGENYRVRVIEPEEGDVIREWHWHYGVGGKNIVCNKRNFGEDCPICDLASSMWQEHENAGRPEGDPLAAAAKKLFAKNRFYVNVLERGDEESGPKVYSCGKRAIETIYKTLLDPDYNGNFLDPENGYDFKVEYTRSDPNDVYTSKTFIKASVKPSPLHEDSDRAKEIVAAAYNLNELYEPAEESVIMEALDRYETPDTNDVGTEKYGGDNESVSGEKKTILDAVNQLESSD